jgi:NADPH-dependent F420 reductase
MTEQKPSIAVIGGTGDLGSGLALRWAKAGYPVVIGSRSAENAARAAGEIMAKAGGTVTGAENADAAAEAEIVVLTVPFANHRPMLEAIKPGVQGKIMVDVTVPLMPPKVMRVQLPDAGSAAKAAQDFLGEGVNVVSAFQNISADLLQNLDSDIECDVLVCGNKKAAREIVVALAEDAGMTAWHCGAIDNSAAAEALTSLLIFINKNGPVSHAGIRITGDPKK